MYLPLRWHHALSFRTALKIGITKKPIRRGTAILPQMQYNVKGFFEICFYNICERKSEIITFSNFDLSRTLFAQTLRLFCPLFKKWLSTSSGAVQGRVGVRQYSQHEVLIAFAQLYLRLTKNIIIQEIPMVNIIIGMPYASDFFTQPQRILLGVIGR